MTAIQNALASHFSDELPSWADKFIPVKVVADLTGLGVTSVWYRVRDGEITPYRIGANKTVFSFREVQDWIAERKQSAQMAA